MVGAVTEITYTPFKVREVAEVVVVAAPQGLVPPQPLRTKLVRSGSSPTYPMPPACPPRERPSRPPPSGFQSPDAAGRRPRARRCAADRCQRRNGRPTHQRPPGDAWRRCATATPTWSAAVEIVTVEVDLVGGDLHLVDLHLVADLDAVDLDLVVRDLHLVDRPARAGLIRVSGHQKKPADPADRLHNRWVVANDHGYIRDTLV